MSKIIYLSEEDRTPHYVLRTTPRRMEVIPKEMFDRIVSGKLKLTDVEQWQPMIKAIIKEWMEFRDACKS